MTRALDLVAFAVVTTLATGSVALLISSIMQTVWVHP
jgi:hypothetical protein